MTDSESFPDIDQAFRDAFNQPEPVPALLEVIGAHPQLTTITDLVCTYMELTAEHPAEVHRFARALVELQNSTEPTIDAFDDFGKPVKKTIHPILNRELADIHSGDLSKAKDSSVTASNDYLIASLLSAISLKYRLCDSPAQVGSIVIGLHPKDNKLYGPSEILVIAACLQLLVAGSYLYGPQGTDVGKQDVPKALELIEQQSVVQNLNGKHLLEATIRQAKSGFKDDVDNAWSILFP